VGQRRRATARVGGLEEVLLGSCEITGPELGGAEVVAHDHRDDLGVGQSPPAQVRHVERHGRVGADRCVELTEDPGAGALDHAVVHTEARRSRCGQPVGTELGGVHETPDVHGAALGHPGPGQTGGQLGTFHQHRVRHVGEDAFELPGGPAQGERAEMGAEEVRGQGPEPSAHRGAEGVERQPAVPEPLGGAAMEVAALPGRRRQGAQDVEDHAVQPVPAAASAQRLDEEVRRGEFGEHGGAVVAVGERVGEIGADRVHDADLPEERQQLRGLPPEHLVEQEAGDAVVVTG
jgi:hypothetical protein